MRRAACANRPPGATRAKQVRRALAALYDRYLDRVYRFYSVRLGSKEAAEDVTSLIFAKALDALATAVTQTDPAPWNGATT